MVITQSDWFSSHQNRSGMNCITIQFNSHDFILCLSISNRAQLAKEMHIEKLMKKNKDNQQVPLRTMLEVMVKFMRERGTSSFSCQLSSDGVNSVTGSVTSPPGLPARYVV